MDSSKTTQNYVSYIYSKEVILKSLLEKGIITDDAFSRYDQILYDRYHIDASLGIPRPIIKEISKIDAPTACFQDGTYLSLTALAREKDASSRLLNSDLAAGNPDNRIFTYMGVAK